MQILLCFPLSLPDAATTTEDEEGEKKEVRDPDTRKKNSVGRRRSVSRGKKRGKAEIGQKGRGGERERAAN